MEVMDSATFDCSTLRERLEPPELHFTMLLSTRAAQRHANVRKAIFEEWKLVCEVWKDGDDLWTWRTTPRGGAFGLVVLRENEVVRAWYKGWIL